MKAILFFIFIFIFLATAVVTILGVTKVIFVEDKYLDPLVSCLLIEVIVVVITWAKMIKPFEEKQTKDNIKSKASFDLKKEEHLPELYKRYIELNKENMTPIDLNCFFKKVETIGERYYELSKLYEELHGKFVSYRGEVQRVSNEPLMGMVVISLSKPNEVLKDMVSIHLPIDKAIDAYSLHKGDIIEALGLVNSKDRPLSLPVYTDKFSLKIMKNASQ